MRLLKRGVRAASKKSYYEDSIIAGFPVSTWLSLTEETYSIGLGGIQFYGWPDGRCLMEQEQCVVDIMKIVLMELAKEFSDGSKKRNPDFNRTG
jgi:hypothetical protein